MADPIAPPATPRGADAPQSNTGHAAPAGGPLPRRSTPDLVIIAAAAKVARLRRRQEAACSYEAYARATTELLDAVDELAQHFVDAAPASILAGRRSAT